MRWFSAIAVVVGVVSVVSIVINLPYLVDFPSSEKLQEYTVTGTESVVVISSIDHPRRNVATHPSVLIQLESGDVEEFLLSKGQNFSIGETIKVDVYSAEGRKPFYSLAQDPIAP